MLCLSAIVVFLSSIDLVVNRRVSEPAMAGVTQDPELSAALRGPRYTTSIALTAPEIAATRRPLREAKRQPLIEDVTSVRGTACPCTAASVPARDRRLSKRLRPPSGLSSAATTTSTGQSVSTGRDRAAPATATIPFLLAPAGGALSQWRPSAIPESGGC